MPGLLLRYESKPELSDSFLTLPVQTALSEAFTQLSSINAGSQIIRTSIQTIDTVGPAIKKSHYLFTEEYYELRTLDAEFGLILSNSRVMLFAPRSRHYFVEKGCDIIMAMVGSKLVKEGNGIALGHREKKSNPPNDQFYATAVKNQHRDEIVAMSLVAETVADRWRLLDQRLDNKTVSVIVHEEESYGRTGRYQTYESSYDPGFFEPALRSLYHLDNGGVMILKVNLLGTRIIADLTYLYKYLFSRVSIIKPACSNPVGTDHYLVATGFNRLRYFSFHDQTKGKNRLDIVLDVLFGKSQTGILRLYSFTKELTAISPRALPLQADPDLTTVSSPAVLNFVTWLVSINNQIGLWLYANITSLISALQDKESGFLEGHSLFVIDHDGYRSSLGYAGRITPLVPISLQGSDRVQPDQSATESGVVTETGQKVTGQVSLQYDPGIGMSFKLCSLLEVFVDDLLKYDIFRPLLPTLGTITGTERISLEMIYRERIEFEHAIKEWLGMLYYFGDLTRILSTPGAERTPDFITKVLVQRKWTLSDLLNKSEDKVRSYNIDLGSAYQVLVLLLSNLARDMETLTALPEEKDPFRAVEPRITPLQDLRFRLSYCLNGKSRAVMCRGASAFGEFDLLNLLTSAELTRVDSAKSIVELVSNPVLINRLAEHASLPTFFCGFATEMAVPSLYFNYKPSIEFFASATNRYAPLWCSANKDDEKLGSLGNFFGSATEASNPIYQDNKLGIAFPPIHPLFFEDTLHRCILLLKDLIVLKRIFGIILVLKDDTAYTGLIEKNLRSSSIVYQDLGPVREGYDPSSGVLYDDLTLKAVRLSTFA